MLRLVGAALVAGLVFAGGARRAEALTIQLFGVGSFYGGSTSVSNLPAAITFFVYSPYIVPSSNGYTAPAYAASFTYLSIGNEMLLGGTGNGGQPQSIQINGQNTSVSLSSEEDSELKAFGDYGTFYQGDGAVRTLLSLNTASFPVDDAGQFSEQSSIPIGSVFGGGFGYDEDGNSTSFGINFDVYAISVNGAPLPSPVPLPASLPLFGAGLLALGGLTYARRRKLPFTPPAPQPATRPV